MKYIIRIKGKNHMASDDKEKIHWGSGIEWTKT